MTDLSEPEQDVMTPALNKAVGAAWNDIVAYVQRNFLDLTGRQAMQIADYVMGRVLGPVRAATLEDFATNAAGSSMPPEIAEAMAQGAREAALAAMVKTGDEAHRNAGF